MSLPFTDTQIELPVEARIKIRDTVGRDAIKGLYVSITPASRKHPNGTRTFSWRYWVAAKRDYDQVEIGEFVKGVFGTKQARAAAKLKYGELIGGADVAAEHRKAAVAKAVDAPLGDLTFNFVADQFEAYMQAEVEKEDGGMRPRVEAHHQITSKLRPARKAFGHVRFGEVTKDQISKLVNSFWDAGKIARGNAVRHTVSQLYTWSYTERNFIEPRDNPCLGLPAPRPTFSKKRFLGPDEIRRFWWGLDAQGAPVERRVALAYRYQLVTGLRPGEVAGTPRAEFAVNDEGEREQHVDMLRTKKRRAIHVPQTTLACEIVDELLALPENKKGMLFPLGRNGAPMTQATMTLGLSGHSNKREQGLCEFLGFTVKGKTKANVPFSAFSSHVLRATVASLLQMDGFDDADVAKVLDHQKVSKEATSSTKDYMRAQHMAHLKRPLLERLEQLIRMCIDTARPEGMSLRTWEKQLKAQAAPAVDIEALQRQIAELQAQVAAATPSKVVPLRLVA